MQNIYHNNAITIVIILIDNNNKYYYCYVEWRVCDGNVMWLTCECWLLMMTYYYCYYYCTIFSLRLCIWMVYAAAACCLLRFGMTATIPARDVHFASSNDLTYTSKLISSIHEYMEKIDLCPQSQNNENNDEDDGNNLSWKWFWFMFALL